MKDPTLWITARWLLGIVVFSFVISIPFIF